MVVLLSVTLLLGLVLLGLADHRGLVEAVDLGQERARVVVGGGDGPLEGGLAAARLPDDGDELARGDVEEMPPSA
jgi:hypothetical protein